MSKKKFRIARIHWLDASSENGWHNRRDVKPSPLPVESVGWLVEETDDAYLLAQSVTGKIGADFLTIPIVSVTDVWIL